MRPGASWVLCTRRGFLVAHERATASGVTVNVWLAGVASDARGRGEFRALVARLLREVGMATTLTMTTRPRRFGTMFAIMSRFARRCDEADDAASGKARFAVAAWQVWLALHRRCVAALAAMALAAILDFLVQMTL